MTTQMAATVEGEGPLVVFGHGLTNDGRTMEDAGIFDFAPIVAAGFRLLRLDWPAHGASEGPLEAAAYTWTSLADDFLALTDELQPDAPVAAIGCSMGTGSILTAAVRRPDRFSRLVLTAPPTAWETRAAQGDMYRQMADLVETQGLATLERAQAAVPAQGIFAELDTPLPVRVSERLLPTVLRGAAEADLPPRDAIRGLGVPTLILSWSDDPGHPVSTGEQLHELIPDSRFAVAGTLAETRAWGAAIADFLSEGE
ncbi:alpha/beta fold hydrolase [Microbacterium horticulturae]|uniref:Alpha/beta fold hydrolase n=1 Tax=Microbacterium horticulturae TaxID=3028316 RepID=A0ABY8BYX3_9MICO|nr:alpha/beta fold hydrolase [Microbacterium sp. KACC 23027]WEG07623.1 alpha/beta fold hydrolase [Microbacterium sp. KACC 23027]